ncbi:phosphomannomutase CpsG [Yersinia intermedia]|jgi:phosphomannomutase|uniref:phosphomannomutase CpsG n=1 Tax=Yersinia intermedia TaxID=631 RepID=UPI0022408D1C|nr:phosphomannomutase CpsG [Yersinia intermedia]UZM70109.1 phosphomannomutase CpsG [Yersinia intermedia]
MSKLTCFKACDIRGRLGEELNVDIAYRIGRAFGQYLKPRQVVVGHDVRLTSESLKLSTIEGLRDSGVDVLDIGLAGTEEVYFATFYLGLDGGIEITASHNPLDYNGMKLIRAEAKPISSDSGLREIQYLAEMNEFQVVDEKLRGKYKKISIFDDYISHIMKYVNINNFRNLRLVINSGNGAAGHVIDGIENYLIKNNISIEIIKINNEPDGNFPNGIPNPLLPQCRAETSNAVREYKADMGIAFDGDFDRCFMFDKYGNFIEGYYIVGLLAETFLSKYNGAKIVHDPRLMWNTIDLVTRVGGIPIMSKTGHAFIKERMRKEDAVYGGEMSAHHYFRDFNYCDSGMIPWLLVAELICIKNEQLDELVNKMITRYPSSGEINRVLVKPNSAIERVKKHYEKSSNSCDLTDGISMEFDEWRFNLRVSNTESMVRLNVESRGNVALMRIKTSEVLDILASSDY